MKNLPLLSNVGLPEVSLTFTAAIQHCKLLYNPLFAVTDMLILTLYFLIFFCPCNYLVIALCLSIFLKLNSFCAQAASKFLAPFFVSLFFWKYIKHLFRGYARFSFPSYFSFNKDFKQDGALFLTVSFPRSTSLNE